VKAFGHHMYGNQKKISRHTIGDIMLLVTICMAMENFGSSLDCNQIFFVTTQMEIEKIWSLYVATLALARDQGKGVVSVRAYK